MSSSSSTRSISRMACFSCQRQSFQRERVTPPASIASASCCWLVEKIGKTTSCVWGGAPSMDKSPAIPDGSGISLKVGAGRRAKETSRVGKRKGAHATACSKTGFDCDQVGQPATAITGDSRNAALSGEIEAPSQSCRGARARASDADSGRDVLAGRCL